MHEQAPPFGFLNAFKPPGPSSTSFGAWVRRLLGAASLGHWGTLDPAASGVLVLAVGRASRLLPYIPSDDKSYVFELRVGTATDTGDATGHAVRTAAVPGDWISRLADVAAALIGPLQQTPPMHSAVKVHGRPLYRAARAGKVVQRQPRPVEIRALRVLGAEGTSARLSLSCSAGTYVRTLCEQIGERLGVPAHMGMLLRTCAGPFAIAHARTPDEIAHDPRGCITDPAAVLSMDAIDLDDAGAKAFAHGNAVEVASAPSHRGRHVLVRHRGALLGVGAGGDCLVPVRVLAETGANL